MLQEVTNYAIPSVFPHLHFQLESILRSALRTLLFLLAFVPHLKRTWDDILFYVICFP